jgi:hypothetical protein
VTKLLLSSSLGTSVAEARLCERILGRLANLPASRNLRRTAPKSKARRDVPEMTDDLIPLRIVIQQLGVSAVPGYRVIVYGDEFKPKHSDFSSPFALLEALEAAIPELDVSSSLQEGQGSIVFDAERLFSEEKLSTLGLA